MAELVDPAKCGAGAQQAFENCASKAKVAELVDAHDSKSCIFGCAGSIPAFGTKPSNLEGFFIFVQCLSDGQKSSPSQETRKNTIFAVEDISARIHFPHLCLL